jgi:hypothetical protein
MAVISFTIETLKTHKEKTLIYTWASVTNADTCAPVEMPSFADRSIQIAGTFGPIGDVRVEGSNDGSNYAYLTNPTGVGIAFTEPGIQQVVEVVRWLRPAVVGGNGLTNLTITLLVRRN